MTALFMVGVFDVVRSSLYLTHCKKEWSFVVLCCDVPLVLAVLYI